MNHRGRLPVMMVATLALGAATCRGGSKPVETPGTGDSGSTSSTTPLAQAATAGAYSCSVQIDEEAPSVSDCHISAKQELTMSTKDITLQASLVPEAFGFGMKGTFQLAGVSQTVATELFKQGGGNHAMVLLLKSGKTLRFSLTPKK